MFASTSFPRASATYARRAAELFTAWIYSAENLDRPYDDTFANLTAGDRTSYFSHEALICRARLDPRARATVALKLFDEGSFEDFIAIST